MKYLLFGFLVLSALLFSSFYPYQANDLKTSMKRGKELYEVNCGTCHQLDGKGTEGVFPPLEKSTTVLNKAKMVKIVLQGMRGSIKVKGKEYNGEMPPLALEDQQVADVLNYVRNSWGNKAPLVTAKEIKTLLNTKLPGFQSY